MRKSFLESASRVAATAALALAGSLVLPVAAQAQTQAEADEGGLTDIVVTARRREENLQDIPVSVTALSSETLSQSGANSTLDLPQLVPSVQMTKNGYASTFYFRGVGNSSGGTGEEGANSFYIDGVYLSDLGQANVDFSNVQRVEVLKGPQGTLFGRNSSGGLVNVITKEPGDTFELNGFAGYGNYNTVKGQLYVAGPVSDKLSVDLALTGKKQSDGFGKNIATGADNMLGWNWGARSKMVFRPSDTVKFVLAGDYYHSLWDDGFTIVPGAVGRATDGAGVSQTWTYAGDYNRNSTLPATIDMEVWGVSLTGEIDLGPVKLTNIAAYRRLKQFAYVESDYGPVVAQELFIPSFNRTFQEELRLSSNTSGPLDWQVGVFYYRGRAGVEKQELRGTSVGGVNGGFNLWAAMKTESIAGFGEANYKITPTTQITAGLRYTSEKRWLNGDNYRVTAGVQAAAPLVSVANQIDFDKLTYRVAIKQDLTEGVNIYGSYSRGFKSGIYAVQSITAPAVKPQTIDAFEIGLKSQFLDNKVRFNIAGYHYDVKDYQVRAAPFGAASPILLNATKVKVDGVEAELEIAPTRDLRIAANVNWLNSRFGDFPGAPFLYARTVGDGTGNGTVCAASTTTRPTVTRTGSQALYGGNVTCLGNAGGLKTPQSPSFSAALGVNYTAHLSDTSNIVLNAQYSYNGGFWFDVDNRLKQKAYSLLNLSATYNINEQWGIEVWGNNVTDTKYYQNKLGATFADHGELAAPATYGFNIRFKY